MKSSISSEQSNQLEKIKNAQEKVFDLWNDYWFNYSALDT
jgi:hypothetical protein